MLSSSSGTINMIPVFILLTISGKTAPVSTVPSIPDYWIWKVMFTLADTVISPDSIGVED